ncbi:hypothetical protein N7G274_005176 [Stereocaulon virgatum]|uniref:Protein kinase domain-containing protein n=1 Tax=Stereocaulon virgatum TaxID=373712 RepID=A0ABR4AA87_9LECA
MAADLKVGQTLQGKRGSYTVREQLHRRIWAAMSSTSQRVTVKTASDWPLKNERDILEAVRDNPCIRPIIDTSDDPPSLILKYLDDNLLNASNAKTLERADIKYVARNLLQALEALHSRGYVHTDIKPDNVLVNNGTAPERFSEVQLGDCGDAFMVDPNASPFEEGHVIGAAIFRSPEAMLNLRWRAPTDIWSFGATLISLIWGNNWHIFKPTEVPFESDEYPIQVLIKQVSIFGPVPLSYGEIADNERLGILTAVINLINEHNLQRPFHLSADKELSKEDRTFICKIMKLDPRDRPTAKELLQDEWFRQE